MERFIYGLVAGGAAGVLVYAVEPVRDWWYMAALVVAFVFWFGRLPDVF
ncbi:hypothetical protein [Streptomyces sp. OE57]